MQFIKDLTLFDLDMTLTWPWSDLGCFPSQSGAQLSTLLVPELYHSAVM